MIENGSEGRIQRKTLEELSSSWHVYGTFRRQWGQGYNRLFTWLILEGLPGGRGTDFIDINKTTEEREETMDSYISDTEWEGPAKYDDTQMPWERNWSDHILKP